MDFTPQPISNRQGLKPSFIYKEKSIILWLNSQFYTSSQFVNNKFYELSFDIPQITLFNTTKLKVVSYIHQSTSAKQMIIRIKNLLYDGLCSHPLNHPILYVANTNVESQLENNEYSLSLLPQTINSITLVLDEQFITNFNGVSAESVQQSITIDNYSDVIRNNVVVNPVVWYKMDTTPNVGIDAMGGQNLSVSSVSYDTSYKVSGSGSAYFNGADYTSLAKSTNFYNLDSKDFSISFWSYNTLTTQTNNIWFFDIGNTFYTGVNSHIGIYRNSLGHLNVYCDSTTLTYSTTNKYLNTWLFLTITYQHSTRQLKLYVNGFIASSTTNTRDFFTEKTFRIGSNNTNLLNFQGYIDDFRIYDTILTAPEITNLYSKLNRLSLPPRFVLGLAIEDADMEVYDSVSPYK